MSWRETSSPKSIIDFSGLLAPRFTPNQENFYELEPAIVFETFEDEPGKVKLITLLSSEEVYAFPLSVNIKTTPLIGELVIYSQYKLVKGSSSGGNLIKHFYEPMSWGNSLHVNDRPDVLEYILNERKNREHGKINPQKDPAIPTKVNKNQTGKYFKRDITQLDKKLISFEGDVIFEGREGQSIRFGNSIPKNFKFNENVNSLIKKSSSSSNGWMFSKNETKGQSPLIIISAGKTNFNGSGLTLENIQNDPSTILLSEGGPTGIEFPFLLSALQNKPKSITFPSLYNNNLILLNSDMLILNSKANSIILSSNEDIIGMSLKNMYFKTMNILELSSNFIHLGENAKKDGQAVVKADDLMDFLSDIIDAVLSLKYSNYGVLIPGTDVGLIQLKQRLIKALSKTGNNPGVFSSKTTFTL